MKAYIISDRNGDSGVFMVVFAETRGKALGYAVHIDEWCDWGFTGLRATRCGALDQYYRGEPEMDWYNDDDRVAMVRYGGFHCSYEYDTVEDDCKSCPAYEWCERGEEAEEDEY